MKILFVTSTPLEYSSSANLRNLALIKGFIEDGHIVSILSARPDINSLYYDDSLLSVEIKNKYYLEIGKLHSHFTTKKEKEKSLINMIVKKIKKIIGKIYNSFLIYDPRKGLVQKVKDLCINESFDYIISSSDPKSSHLLVEELINQNGVICKKWIQYWGDPFVNDINRKGILPYKYIKAEEERILNKADEVVYVSPFTLNEQSEMFYEIKHKFKFIPVPFMNKIYYEVDDDKNKTYTIGYFGDYYSSDRDITHLYNVVKESEYKLNIFGYSDISLVNTNGISVNGRTKYEVIKKYEQNSDLLVCLCNKNGTQIPGKIYHYAASNKPILIILDGNYVEEMKNYFESFDRYYLCENNEESISTAIEYAKKSNRTFEPSPFFEPQKIAKLFLGQS